MPRICYVPKEFRVAALSVVAAANQVIDEYIEQGYRLTLRQLYYQFVARDLIPNTQRDYKRLGGIVNDARLAGLIDWDAIEDRTRNLESLGHWRDPADIVGAAARSFRIDRWAEQLHRVEVWIEKEALAGVFERVCEDLRVPYLSCRGYTSQSEMWGAAQRLIRYHDGGQAPVILHFGDHDPSGIDMTRDIEDRLTTFGCDVEVRRLALNMDQVEAYTPPPNPAKQTDSRFQSYIRSFGAESWELDALEPQVLADLVRDEVMLLVEPYPWSRAIDQEQEGRTLLQQTAARFEDVADFLNNSEED